MTSSVQVPESYNLTSDLLDRHLVEGRGNRLAVLCGKQRWTYAEVADAVNRLAAGLRRLGVQEEQRVLLLLPDTPEFIIAFLGSIKIGAVAVPTNTTLRAADYAYFLDVSRARVLIADSSFWPILEPILKARRYLGRVVLCGEPREGHLGWDELLDGQSPECEASPTRRNDVAFWLWTSGSTGIPKAALHLHQNWVYSCEYYARGILNIGPQDRTFSLSKLFHAYGLGNGLAFPFYVGATSVLFSGRPLPGSVLQTAHQTRPSLFFSVPTLFAHMLQETDQDNPYDLSSVRLAVSAAEPLPAPIYRRWRRRFGMEILDGIGSTEVLHIYVSAKSGEVRASCTGKPVPGYQVRITNEAGSEVAPGEIGDLWVKGESTAPCYWQRHRLSKERMQGEWFFTGDKYRCDKDGYFWYAGRCDDMFRVSGQWVSPIEIENTLIDHPAVLESAVVPFADEDDLLRPRAFLVLDRGWEAGESLVRELQEFVKQNITPYKYPRRIDFVRELPKTAAGKIQRFKLRRE